MKRFIQYHSPGGSAIEDCEADSPRPQCFFCSKAYETEAELREARSIHPEPCKECGCPFTLHYAAEVRNVLLEQGICHGCNHWRDQMKRSGGLVIEGQHYRALPASGGSQGFGGREFSIRKLDTGEVIQTRNLWHQGIIPPHFRDRLPDNAEFVETPKPMFGLNQYAG